MRRAIIQLSLLFGIVVIGSAGVPNTITYQGSLKQNGAPVNGTYPVEIRITNAAGTEIYWTSGNRNVDITEGLYRIELTTPTVDWANKDPYIETRVNSVLLLPREKMTSTPYALIAKDISSAVAGPGLIGGSGAPMAVNVDNSTLEVSTDTLRIKNNGVTNEKIVSMDMSKLTGTLFTANIINAQTSMKFGGFETLKIMQIKVGVSNTPIAITGTAFRDSNISVSITPKLTSSKILVFCFGTAHIDSAGEHAFFTLARNATNIGDPSFGLASILTGGTDTISMMAYDSPATISAVTYKAQMRSTGQALSVRMPYNTGGLGTPRSTIIAIEIAQ